MPPEIVMNRKAIIPRETESAKNESGPALDIHIEKRTPNQAFGSGFDHHQTILQLLALMVGDEQPEGLSANDQGML
jgi:hypothetical protein